MAKGSMQEQTGSAMQCKAMQRSDHVAAPVKRNAAAAAAVKSFVGEKNLFFLSIDGFPPAPFRAAAYRLTSMQKIEMRNPPQKTSASKSGVGKCRKGLAALTSAIIHAKCSSKQTTIVLRQKF